MRSERAFAYRLGRKIGELAKEAAGPGLPSSATARQRAASAGGGGLLGAVGGAGMGLAGLFSPRAEKRITEWGGQGRTGRIGQAMAARRLGKYMLGVPAAAMVLPELYTHAFGSQGLIHKLLGQATTDPRLAVPDPYGGIDMSRMGGFGPSYMQAWNAYAKAQAERRKQMWELGQADRVAAGLPPIPYEAGYAGLGPSAGGMGYAPSASYWR